MMSSFSVAPMNQSETDQAYALVRTFAPEISRELWNAYAISQFFRGGFLLLWGPERTVFGFASYRIEQCARAGRVMLVENFVTVELRASGPGRELLAAAIARLAAETGCAEIRQIVGDCRYCAPEIGALRNHMALVHAPGGTRFNCGPHCPCGNLRPLSATAT